MPALRISVVLVAALLGAPAATAQTNSPTVRTFPQFVGTWTLDEAASSGNLRIVPRIPVTITLATSPTELTVTKRLRLGERDRASATPAPEVYRLDGVETWQVDDRTGVLIDRSYRFTLVADMLALTVKERGRHANQPFTLVTDALSVDGDVLTLHRQLASVTANGSILTMREPTNNFRHTYIYRRTVAP